MRGYLIVFLILVSVIMGRAATKRALLIGISDYPAYSESVDATWSPIHGANDVQIIGKTLKAQGFKISTLTNSNATASKIRKALKKIRTEVRAGDILYLHFSCHGQPVEDLNGDEKDGWDEAIVPYDAQKIYRKGIYKGENHILDDELNNYLKAIRTKVGPQGFVYVIIDACHAGSSYRGDDEEDSVVIRGTNSGFSKSNKPFAPRMNEQSKRSKIKIEKSVSMANICILEACRSYEKNREILEKGKYYGSLTYYVNKTLQTIQLGKNVSWTEKVYNNLRKDVRLQQLQNPVIETSL